MAKTVAAYNNDMANERDSAFRREPLGQPRTEPPFHAPGPAKSWILLTEGGVAVTTRMEVLSVDDQTVPGLYAAGSNGQGRLLLEGHGNRHGNHLGWAFTSGRIARRSAAFGSQAQLRSSPEAAGHQS